MQKSGCTSLKPANVEPLTKLGPIGSNFISPLARAREKSKLACHISSRATAKYRGRRSVNCCTVTGVQENFALIRRQEAPPVLRTFCYDSTPKLTSSCTLLPFSPPRASHSEFHLLRREMADGSVLIPGVPPIQLLPAPFLPHFLRFLQILGLIRVMIPTNKRSPIA